MIWLLENKLFDNLDELRIFSKSTKNRLDRDENFVIIGVE